MHLGKVQKRWPVDELGDFLPLAEGGEIEPLVCRKRGKFVKQACGLFGVAVVNGNAFRSEGFRYSSVVVSTGRFQKELRRERKRCWNLPKRPYDPITGRYLVVDMSRRFNHDGTPNFQPGPGNAANKLGQYLCNIA